MKNRIITVLITLMLVFTNIIPVLAFSTSDNYFSDSNNVNFVQTATTTTTTTTKPNYTYTTTPNYYYPVWNTTTTTKPNYTYTTTPNYYYPVWNTTTTNPVNFSDSFNNDQWSTYVNLPTTTVPNYQVNFNANVNPMALNAIPTTTRPDVIIANSAFDRSLIAFKPIPTTTKPIVTITDQNVIKNLKVSSAVTTTTIPNYILANTQQFDLTHKTQTLLASLEANLLGLLDLVTAKKKDVVDENLQVLTIGDEEKNINGALIIVVLEDGEYELGLPNYIARKEQEGYQVKIEKVSNIGKKPEQMKDYFKKMKLADPNFKFAVIPLNYLSGMVVYNGSRIAISDYYYCKLFDNSSTTLTGLFSPEIYISRANRAMLEKEYIKLTENKMLITFPIMRFLHKIYDEGCWYADLKKADPSRLGDTLKQLATGQGINTKTFYETRGIEPAVNKPDFQLSLENILRESTDANFILSSNTAEFTYIDMKKNKQLIENFSGNLTSAIYKFDNGNNYADPDEIALETITNFSGLNNIDRIGGLFFENNENNPIDINFSSYAIHRDEELAIKTAKYYGEIPDEWIRSYGPGLEYNDDGSGLVPSYIADVRFFTEGILNGETVAEALWNIGYKSFWSFDKDYVMPFDDIVYGDPAKTLEDTIEQPRAKIITDNLKDEYIINIPKGKFEIDFIIKNIGKLDVTYSFDKSDIIEISPISGIIPINNETKIHLKALEHLNINAQSSEEINNNLKPKSAKIYFKSNAGDKELTVKYWDL